MLTIRPAPSSRKRRKVVRLMIKRWIWFKNVSKLFDKIRKPNDSICVGRGFKKKIAARCFSGSINLYISCCFEALGVVLKRLIVVLIQIEHRIQRITDSTSYWFSWLIATYMLSFSNMLFRSVCPNFFTSHRRFVTQASCMVEPRCGMVVSIFTTGELDPESFGPLGKGLF